VNWLRNNEKPEDVNEPLTALTNLGEHQCRRAIDSHAKKKAIDDAMNWLRNNDLTRPTWTIRQPRALLGYPCPAVCLRREAQWLRIQ
jgi:hypothetical protein